MTPEQAAFVARRRAQITYWPWLGGLLLVLLLGFFLFAYLQYPLYFNPSYLVQALNAGRVSPEQLAELAALGSLAFLGCAGFMLVLLLFPFVALATEKRLIAIIEVQEAALSTPLADETPHDPA